MSRRPLRFGMTFVHQDNWDGIVERVERYEMLGLDSAWVADHFVSPWDPTRPWLEAWSLHALRSRGLGNLRSVLPVRVDLSHREVSERKAKVLPERFSQCRNDRLCRAAIRALEIAVLHE